jgi:Spy/CpxP family protein refolding chaperone
MDILMQKKLLVRIVILLTVLNLSFIGLFVWKDFVRKPPRENNRNNPNNPKNPNNPNNGREQPNSRDIFEILKRELKLSKEQVDQIRNLRSGFSETEKLLSDAIKSGRDSMNIVMFNKETNEEIVKSLARRVAENNYKMELLRFEQAQKLKAICTPSQQEKFEGLVLEIRDFFRIENQPNNKPRL